MMISKNTLYIAIAGALVAAGLTLGYLFYRPEPPKPELPAEAIRQEDSSLVLERKPNDTARPAHKVPKGATVERVIKVEVQPERVADAGKVMPVADGGCPPVTVDMTLVRMPDDSRRVVASSPAGQVLGGVDMPVESARAYKEFKWAAGASYNPLDSTFGAWIDRDLGPFRVGGEFNQAPSGFDVRVKAGIRF